jgi:hypothetical protein
MGRRFVWPICEERGKPGSQSAETRFFLVYNACSFTMLFSGKISVISEVPLKVLSWMGGRQRIGQKNRMGAAMLDQELSFCDCDTPRLP